MSRTRRYRGMLMECGAKKTVLLVEDDDWLRAILSELLVDDGYRVIEAADGHAVLRLATSEGPDVMVLDLKLPGPSGLDILHALRAREPTADLPVIVLSEGLDLETRGRLIDRAERANVLLEKPVDVGQLFDEVERAIA
jgi:CheY-like chemotaxis protein